MGTRHIVCVEPASGRGEVVVVEVQQHGTQPLDVRLVGCEGENPYVTTIKQRHLGKLKQKFKGDDDGWAAVLSHFLLQQQPEREHAHLLEGARLVYTLNKTSLDLSVRQDVEGIKVTLGEITLPQDEDFEFNPFEWAQASAKAHAKSLQELADVKARASSEQDTIAKLKAQLDDLIKTKNEAETVMLQQFMELLNEKKRKIRDQNRMLAAAKVDPSTGAKMLDQTATAVQSSRNDGKSRKPTASRQSKRKAPAQAAEPDLKEESDSDRMEMDQAKEGEEQSADEGPAATPDPSDDETDTEEDVPPEIDGRPPPKRELPFGRPPAKQPAPAAEDDETDDEEL